MINDADKVCAFFRRSWWETACRHLSDSERLALYEAVFAFQFSAEDPAIDLPPMVAMLFDLIKPVLASDREKMQHRAEVARQNGAAGGRPRLVTINQELSKPSGLNGNPAGFFGLPIYNTNVQDTTANNKSNVCVSEMNSEDTHTKFLVCVEFFLMGVADPIEEAKMFYGYYDAREWVTKDGAKIKNIVALSRSWHPKTLTQQVAKKRAAFGPFLKSLENSDFSLFERLLAANIDNSLQTVFFFVRSEADAVYLDERYINPLSYWVKDPKTRGENWHLEYRFNNPT